MTVQVLVICLPFMAQAKAPGIESLENEGFFELSQSDLTNLSSIFQSEPELFRALDELYRQGNTSVFQTLLSEKSVVPSLLYISENNVTPRFESAVIRRFDLGIREQAEILLKMQDKIAQNPDMKRKLKASMDKILTKVQKIKPEWTWHGQRTLNVALFSAGIVAFAYSFEASFIPEQVRPNFAEMMTVVRNLVLLYSTIPLVADMISLKQELGRYFSERREMAETKSNMKKVVQFFKTLSESPDLGPYLDFAQSLGDPTLGDKINKWTLQRRDYLLQKITAAQKQKGFVSRLRERALLKDLNNFETFMKQFDVGAAEAPQLGQALQEYSRIASQNPDLVGQEIVEREFNELCEPLNKITEFNESVKRSVTRTNILLSMSLTVMGLHASLGASPDVLDPILGKNLVGLIRQNTQLIYLAAALPAIIPIAEFWKGVYDITKRTRYILAAKRANLAIEALFTRSFQSRIMRSTKRCEALVR